MTGDDEDDDEAEAVAVGEPAGDAELRRPGLARARPWQGARPGSAMRLGAEDELLTIVSFDVPSDKERRLVGEMCKDYGLRRLQWSVFEGPMTRNRREELWGSVLDLLEGAPGGGKLAMFPIGGREASFAQREVVKGLPMKRSGGGRIP